MKSAIFILGIVGAGTLALHAMEPQEKTQDEIVAVLKQNEQNARNAASRKGLPGPVSFTLLVIHPTPNLTRIDHYVDQNKPEITKKGYKINNMEKRHLTLMTFHVPFTKWMIDEKYASHAVDQLARIVRERLARLYDTNFSYTEFGTLVAGKHLVAFHEFSTPADRQNFYKAYHTIVQKFLKLYPKSWMSVPYEFKPHVTVATRKGPFHQPVNLPGQGRGAFENKITLGYQKTKWDPKSRLSVSSKSPGIKRIHRII